MICTDDSHLLYIHPTRPPAEPVWDKWCEKLAGIMCEARVITRDGTREGSEMRTRGFHLCTSPPCGAYSSNTDYVFTYSVLFKSSVDGMHQDYEMRQIQLNSLAMHYLVCHRDEVPASEMDKLKWVGRG